MRPDEPAFRGRAAPGRRLNGIYEIERLIGIGGMGEVYKGRAVETGDPVAIKMIRAELAENEAALALFRKEASALHNLYHEAIVRYYVFTIDPALGVPYLAMEFVEGRSLSEALRQGRLSFDEVLVLQRRLAAGLQAAHDLGIVHRDVSPDNIIVPGGNVARAKIIDFGIARSMSATEGTIIGSGFAGKFTYVSPEQLGLFGGDVGPKSDIYSLGLVLVQALLGHPLDMGGNQIQVLEKRRSVPDLGEVDPRIRPLFRRMLQPDPRHRPHSMAEVAAWKPEAPAAPRAGRGRLGGRLGLWLAGAGAAAALGGAAFLLGPRLLAPVERPIPPDPGLERADRGRAPGAAEEPDQGLLPPAGDPPSLPSPAEPRPGGPGADPAEPGPSAAPGPGGAEPSSRPAEAPMPPATPQAPPSPPPARPGPRSADDVRRYVADYRGGACFFAAPLAVTDRDATIEAYGASAAPFQMFDDAFREANGFEAQIELRKITPAQCPVTAFLARAARGNQPPRLQIGAFSLRNRQALTGSVEAGADRHVELLLVSDEGLVYNLARYVRRSGGAVLLNVRELEAAGGGPRPQILIALVTAQPLAVLASRAVTDADKLLPAILDEAARTGQRLDVAVKYFRIE